MPYNATRQHVHNRGRAPIAFLDELVAWGRSAPDEIFAPNTASDIYSSVRNTLGPWQGVAHRRAVMLEVLRVLGGFESSWNWNLGVDESNPDSDTPVEIEAGIFQVSANSMNFGAELRELVHREAGATDPVTFQREMKRNHPLALEYCARLLRRTIRHHGPIRDGHFHNWLRRDAVEEFLDLLGSESGGGGGGTGGDIGSSGAGGGGGTGGGSGHTPEHDDGHGSSNPHTKPEIKEFIQSPNRSSRNGHRIDMIVMHCTEGSLQGTINTFLNPGGRQVSAHYVIDRNGDIIQMVSDNERANHCRGANQNSIGIEHVGTETQAMAPAQTTASAALIRWLLQQYDIPRARIFGHDFAPGYTGGGTSCPDRLFGPNHTQAAVTAWVNTNV